MEAIDSLVQWSLDHCGGDLNAVWRKLCLLAHGSSTNDSNAPNQARLFKGDVLRAMNAMDIAPALSKKEREAMFVRLCNGNHGSSALGMADFRREMTPRIKALQAQRNKLQRYSDMKGVTNPKGLQSTITRASANHNALTGRDNGVNRGSATGNLSLEPARNVVEQDENQYRSVSSANTTEGEQANVDQGHTEAQLQRLETGLESPEAQMLETAREEVDTRISQVVERLHDFAHHIKGKNDNTRIPAEKIQNPQQSYLEQNTQSIGAESSGSQMKAADMVQGYGMMLDNAALLEKALNELEGSIHELGWLQNIENGRDQLIQMENQLRQMEQQKNQFEARCAELEQQIQDMKKEQQENQYEKKGRVSVLTHNTLVDLLEGKGHISGWREI